MRVRPSARAACAFTTAGRRSASTMTRPQGASANRASLRATDRSKSSWVCTSPKAQYAPAGRPSAPRTPADCTRTRTRPPSLRSSAHSCTRRSGVLAMAAASRSRHARGVRRAHRPARQAAAPDGLLGGPAEDPLGLAVPVGDHVPSASNAQSAASIPSSSVASRSAPARPMSGRAPAPAPPSAPGSRPDPGPRACPCPYPYRRRTHSSRTPCKDVSSRATARARPFNRHRDPGHTRFAKFGCGGARAVPIVAAHEREVIEDGYSDA